VTPEAERLRAANELTTRAMVAALERADGPAVAELLAADVAYYFPGRSPLAGTYRGRDQVMGLFRALAARLGAPPRLHSHDVLASEAHAVDLAVHSADRGGRPFEWRAVRIYHFGAGGLITEIYLTIEDLYAFDTYLE
jgi:ketosteroid isomerase-like protein